MSDSRIIDHLITLAELQAIAAEQFGDMIKAVVDIQRGVMAVGGELHADEEAILLEHGSNQSDLWGINLYPDEPEDDWLEFDSMINLRPSQGNRSRGVEDATIRNQIRSILIKLVKRP